MILTLIYHVIKKICQTIIKVLAWLLVSLSLWVPLVYTVIFVVWCGFAGKSLSALSTVYWAGLGITFIGSFFISAFLYERKQKSVSKSSAKGTPDNAETVKYKSDTAELKKRTTNEDESEEEEYSEVSPRKKQSAESNPAEETVEERDNRLSKHIREERERLQRQGESAGSKTMLNKEDLYAAREADNARIEGSLGYRPQPSYGNNNYNNAAANPHGFTPYNNGQAQPPPFINPYQMQNPLTQANNPYSQPAGNNSYNQGYNGNYNNAQQGNYNNSANNPYGFAPYDANPYKLKPQPELNARSENPYDSFYNDEKDSYKAFDRNLTDEIRLNTQRQEAETPKIFAVKNDPTLFIHEYSDRLEYFKRTRQGMVFMKAVNK